MNTTNMNTTNKYVPEMITITKIEFDMLIAIKRLLDELKSNGLYKWEGYLNAVEYLHKEP